MKTPGRILVIGGLAAGPAAAAKAKRLNPNLDITVFEQGEYISYGTCSMPYYIGGTIESYDDLITYSPQAFEKEKHCEVKTLHRVEEILPHRRRIIVQDIRDGRKSEYAYDRLLMATGAKARVPNPEWLRAENVFTVKSLDDSIRLKAFLDDRSPREAVVVGAGFIGLEMADVLRNRGLNVTLVHDDNLPMSVLDPEARRIILDELKRHDVRFMGGDKLKDVLIHDKLATHVLTNSEKRVCDVVVLALGFEPNTGLARQARIRLGKTGGVIVDDYLRTSADHIFAAGGCCEIRNLVSGKPMISPLATVSNKMGWAAGSNLAGKQVSFNGSVGTWAVKVFDLEVASVGLGTREAELAGYRPVSEAVIGRSKGSHYPGGESILVKLVADRGSRRVLGATIIGEEGAALRINVLATAISAKMTVDDVTRLDLMYTPPFSPLWDPVLIAANQVIKKL